MVNSRDSQQTTRRAKRCSARPLVLESLERRELRAGDVALLADVAPGNVGSNSSSFIGYEGNTVFTANDTEIWKTDGTSAGTVLVADLSPSAGSYAYVSDLVAVNGMLAFGVLDFGDDFFDNADDRVELWKTDGTAGGTVLVKDFGLGSTLDVLYSRGAYLTESNGLLFGVVSTPGTGNELFRSDLTSAGTVIVKDIEPGSAGSAPYNLVSADGTLYFSASKTNTGVELWKTDGTSNGTVMLEDLNGSLGSFPTPITPFGGDYFFVAFDNATPGLWKTDGSIGGATLLDSFSGAGNSPPQLTAVGDSLFGVADFGASGTELWKSDGTTNSAQLVKDINPGSASSFPYELTDVNGKLFFAATSSSGDELWMSDGTSAGTVIVKDINPGPSSSVPARLTVGGGKIYFSADDGVDGTELWMSDGTSAGTTLVQDISSGSFGSYPTGLAVANGALYFAANDNVVGDEPYRLELAAPAQTGLFNNGRFYLDTTDNGQWDGVSAGDTFHSFGINSLEAIASSVVGDWNGDGTDDVGLFHNGRFYLDTTGNGQWDGVSGGDTFHNFGINSLAAIATPVIGDWDGDGTDDLGLFNNGRFYLDATGNGQWDGVSGGDTFHNFGINSLKAIAKPVIGDWEGNGTDNLGLFNDGRFYLDTNGNGQWDSVAGGDTYHNFGINSIAAAASPVMGTWAVPAALLAADGAVPSGSVPPLTEVELAPVLQEAIAAWVAFSPSALETLANVQFIIADLSGDRLGLANGSRIILDVDAAGHGWFSDATPDEHEEFEHHPAGYLDAKGDSLAFGRIDLLTAVMHEIGHVLGFDHDDELEIMVETLATGRRHRLQN